MLKVPTFDEPTKPTDSAILKLKNSTLFMTSFITEIIAIAITLLNIKHFSIAICLIIILSFTCLILFIDLILMYVKDRENHFKYIYLTNMYESMCNEINKMQTMIENSTNNTNDLKKQINKMKS